MKTIRDIKNVRIKLVSTLAFCLLILILWIDQTPCPVKYFTGIPCPCCYITRGLISAFRLDFVTAWNYHPMFWSVPVLYLFYLFDGAPFKRKYVNGIILAAIAVGFLATWTVRLILLFTA